MTRAELLRRGSALVTTTTRYRREMLASFALLAGWTLITHGIAGFAPRHAGQVWPISIGILLLSLFGWRVLRDLVVEGLYMLTREPEDGDG